MRFLVTIVAIAAVLSALAQQPPAANRTETTTERIKRLSERGLKELNRTECSLLIQALTERQQYYADKLEYATKRQNQEAIAFYQQVVDWYGKQVKLTQAMLERQMLVNKLRYNKRLENRQEIYQEAVAQIDKLAAMYQELQENPPRKPGS